MLIAKFKYKLPNFNISVDFTMKKGILGILGSSGSGKSMTLKSISGLEKPASGFISLDNKIFYDSSKNICLKPQKRKIGYVFQNYALMPHMNVIENIKLGMQKKNLPHSKIDILCSEYIERFGLSELQKKYPWQLSGGQQQRTALARALITKPDILLLDEPFSALDHHLRLNMQKELMSILKTFNGYVLFVTHDIEEAYRLCKNIMVFEKGSNFKIRNKIELFNNPSNFEEAKITGCKNISPVKIIGYNKVYAQDWDLELNIPINNALISSSTKDNFHYIGIRAHYIQVIKPDTSERDNINIFIVKNIIENPFNFVVYVKKFNCNLDNIITFFLSKKDLWFKIGDKLTLKFPQENLFVF